MLTVALEDYYQVGSFNRAIQRGQWYRFETRFEHNTLATLELLERFDIKATFFVLGWIADRYPEVVRMVAEHGHEVASKGYYHRSIRQMTPGEFREDLVRSREALEKTTGTRVLGYRVAHEWFLPEDLWALDVLADLGFAYDSSICPMFRRFHHEPWRCFVHQHPSAHGPLWEFPLSSARLLGLHLPIAGGNYFRQLPHGLMRRAVQRWHRTIPAPFVMYFHIWELDPDQPKINTPSLVTRHRHYRNLDKMSGILEHYFKAYRLTSIADYLGLDPASGRGQGPAATPRDGLAGAAPVADVRSIPDAARPCPAEAAPASWPATRRPISIVIPCFNEELILLYLANTLKSVLAVLERRYDVHLIFVDDGSADDSWNALWKVFGDWKNVSIVRHERNRGVTAAIQTGIERAETEIVCSIDCDCTYDPHELADMIPLLADDVDLVTASPYHPQGHVRNVPAWRLGLSKSASFLYRRVLRQKLHTYTSCFRVYRRSRVAGVRVRHQGYLGIVEMLGLLDHRGVTVVEYPTTLEVRMLGRSKMKTLWTIVGHLGMLTRLLVLRLLRRAPALTSCSGEGPASRDRAHKDDPLHLVRNTM